MPWGIMGNQSHAAERAFRRGQGMAAEDSVDARRETVEREQPHLAAVDTGAIRASVEGRGYAVVHDLVDSLDIAAMREFWLDEFRRCRNAAPIIWGPYLGEPNTAIFDRRDSHCLYRSFDYLWNPPYHPLTREVGLALNRVRNRIVGNEERCGELFAGDRYCVYVTTSYYPPGLGWMWEHGDETGGREHWHFVLPLTFRGPDYTAGGLYLIDRNGTRVDVDAETRVGSVVFYDGHLPHGVEKIEAGDDNSVGRLQMFAIPVLFDAPNANDRLIESIPIHRFVRRKLGLIKRRLRNAASK